MGYLELVGVPDAETNRRFLRENPDHWLALTHKIMHGGSDRFADMACAVTAHATMWRIGVPVEGCVPYEPASLREAVKNEKLVVAEVDGGDHWFLIVEGHIVESWWKKYGPRVFVCDDAFLREYETNEIEYRIPNKPLFN
jgi:hypothetical protein